MTTALAARTTQRRLSAQDRAQAKARGSSTVTRQIRVVDAGPDASVSTILSEDASPPAWVEHAVQEDLPTQDDFGVIALETFVRFAQVCGELPTATPKPHLSVGDDATLGAEWDIGIFHIEFQVGNDPEVDAIIFEVDEGDISEIPLAGNSRVLAAIIAKIISGRQA